MLRQHVAMVSAMLVDLEGCSRRNNIIFKWLTWGPTKRDFRQVISKFCGDNFESGDGLWVYRAFRQELGHYYRTLFRGLRCRLYHVADHQSEGHQVRCASGLPQQSKIEARLPHGSES